MMHGVIREVCALSVFCGLAMSIMPEGSVKRVAGVLCTAATRCCLQSIRRKKRR